MMRLLALCCGALIALPVTGQDGAWDKIENIREAASRIRFMQDQRGYAGASAAVEECYFFALRPGRTYGKATERCMAQDYVISQVAARVFSSVSPEARRLSNSPEPEAVLLAMNRRILKTMAYFKVPEQDARAFIALVKEHGFAAFEARSK
jgi:hypothetical protein